MVNERNIYLLITRKLLHTFYIFHECLFLAGLWKSIFSVLFAFSYGFQQILTETMTWSVWQPPGNFVPLTVSLSLPLPVCWNSWQSWQHCLLMFPLMLLILRLSLAQNCSEQSRLGGEFVLNLTLVNFLENSFLPSLGRKSQSYFSQTDFPEAAVLRTKYCVF